MPTTLGAAASSARFAGLQAQIGWGEFCRILVDSLVVPETTVIDGRVEVDLIDAHRRERERRLRRQVLAEEGGGMVD